MQYRNEDNCIISMKIIDHSLQNKFCEVVRSCRLRKDGYNVSKTIIFIKWYCPKPTFLDPNVNCFKKRGKKGK